MEIERKFLVEKLPELPAAEAIHIEQGYIHGPGDSNPFMEQWRGTAVYPDG